MHLRPKFAMAVTAGVFSMGLGAMGQGAIIYNQVAASGQAVPSNPNLVYTTAGAPNADTTQTTSPITNETFSIFGASAAGLPSINQAGDVAFTAVDTGSANVQATQTTTLAQNTAGLFSYQGGTLVQLAHEGTYAPDRAGNAATALDSTGTFSTFAASTGNSPIFIGSNDVITDFERVKAYKTSGGSDDSVTPTIMTTGLAGIVSTKSGSLALLYRQNDALNGVNINSLAPYANAIAVTPSGTIAAALDAGSPSGTNLSFASDAGGTLHFVAQNGAASPITGVTFNGAVAYSGSYVPVINPAGQMAFKQSLAGTGITTNNNIAIFSQGGGSLHLVAQGYGQAPSTAAGDAYLETSISNPDINQNGQLTFSDGLTTNTALGAGDIVTATSNATNQTANNSGLFAEYTSGTNPGGVSLVARKGNQAFGLSAGTVYSGFNNPLINDAGRIAVEVSLSNAANTATLATGTTAAFYTFDQSGTVSLVAQTGQIAPGTSLYFNSFGLNNYAINALGEVAFESPLAATIGGSSAGTGLFAQDNTGTLQLLLQTGQTFTISPGVVSTVSSFTSLSNSGGEDGRLLSWNDNGTVAVDITFANGQQGIYTVSVPEPTATAIAGLASCLLLRRRSRVHAA